MNYYIVIFFLAVSPSPSIKCNDWNANSISISECHSCLYLTPSSAAEFHFREMGNGTTSVMEISRTLKAGERIAHCEIRKQSQWGTEKNTKRSQLLSNAVLLNSFKSAEEPQCDAWLTWRAHPLATASSAFSVVLISFPKNLLILSLTAGILEAPPTISTAWMSSFFRSAQKEVTDRHVNEWFLWHALLSLKNKGRYLRACSNKLRKGGSTRAKISAHISSIWALPQE